MHGGREVGEGDDALAGETGHGGGDGGGNSPGVEVGGGVGFDEAADGAPAGGIGPAHGMEELDWLNDAGVTGEGGGGMMAQGGKAVIAFPMPEQLSENLHGIRGRGGIEQMENAQRHGGGL